MGPYYRGTTQGMGHFFDMFYQNPLLMFGVTAAVTVFIIWRWRKQNDKSDL